MRRKRPEPLDRIEIRPHPRYPETHWVGIVTTAAGYCWACTWAEPEPDRTTVLEAWRTDRRAFDPYRG